MPEVGLPLHAHEQHISLDLAIDLTRNLTLDLPSETLDLPSDLDDGASPLQQFTNAGSCMHTRRPSIPSRKLQNSRPSFDSIL